MNIVREVGRVGEKLRWDPKIERFTNCDEANQSWYISRPRRKGYELPDRRESLGAGRSIIFVGFLSQNRSWE